MIKKMISSSVEAAEVLMKSRSVKGFAVVCVCLMMTTPVMAAGDPTAKIKKGIKNVLGLIMAIAFIAGVIICMYGAKKKIDGEPGAYYAIVGGALLAMAPLIMGALYFAFGFGTMATTDVTW